MSSLINSLPLCISKSRSNCVVNLGGFCLFSKAEKPEQDVRHRNSVAKINFKILLASLLQEHFKAHMHTVYLLFLALDNYFVAFSQVSIHFAKVFPFFSPGSPRRPGVLDLRHARQLLHHRRQGRLRQEMERPIRADPTNPRKRRARARNAHRRLPR